MRDILDEPSRRLIDILDVLIDQEGWITFAELADAVGSSERTIAKDVGILRKRWEEDLDVVVSARKGIRLNRHNVSTISKVFRDVFNASTALKLVKDIILEPKSDLEFYGGKIFASKSTLNRQLPRINRFFAERGMGIEYHDGGYELVGENEQHVREFCTGFLLELYGFGLAADRMTADIPHVGAIVGNILTNNLDPVEVGMVMHDEIAIAYYIAFYLVSLMRERQGYDITSSYEVERELTAENLDYLATRSPSITNENLRPIHEFIAAQYRGWDSPEEKELVSREAQCFLARVFENVELSPSDETFARLHFLIRSAYLKAKARPYPTSTLFDRIHYFCTSVKKNNAFLYDLVNENIVSFSRNVGFDISSQSETVLFWMCLMFPQMANFIPEKRGLVVSDFGIQHAEFLADRLSSFFNEDGRLVLGVETTGPAEASSLLEAGGFDVVVSTMPNLPTERSKLVLVNDYPEHDDLCRIYRILCG